MSRASRKFHGGDNARRCLAMLDCFFCERDPWETGPQRRRRIADGNRAERLAPSARTRARMEADGLRFVGFYKASEGRRRRGEPMAWRPSWCEWWVGPYRDTGGVTHFIDPARTP